MQLTELTTINVDADRMRKVFDEDAQAELEGSILSKGLFHPIGIEERSDGKLWLVYGERRLRAMAALHRKEIQFRCNGDWIATGLIPFTWVTELEPIEILEAELEENLKRKDLSWQETVDARAKLFKLRKAQAAERGETYNATNLAAELKRAGASQSTVQQVARQLVVARHLDDPKVRKARTFEEAAGAAKKSTENIFIEALGDLIQEEAKPIQHTLIEGDALEILSKLDANKYDCVLTDPPYGIDINDSGSMVTHDHHYDDSEETLRRILDTVPLNLYRITRSQAHVYWFCDLRMFHLIADALEEAGFAVCKFPIIWWKRGKAMAPDSTRWPKREYECIIYAIKGDKAPLKVAGDVISTPYGSELQQAEKPRDLYVELLSRSVLAGSQVIDPFCGSGVIFSAAEELKCTATGIEIDPERADFARIRASGEL